MFNYSIAHSYFECKITAIFLPEQIKVIVRHSFCGKNQYRDKIFIFVTKYHSFSIRHNIK